MTEPAVVRAHRRLAPRPQLTGPLQRPAVPGDTFGVLEQG
jgi:hypothetical protein